MDDGRSRHSASTAPPAHRRPSPEAGPAEDSDEVEDREDPEDPEGNPWVTRERRVVYANPWITVEEDEVLRPDGSPGIYGVVRFPGRALGVVALDDHDRIVLVGQFRYTLGRYSWEIPEGASGAGEDPLAGAQRELLEETGLRAERWRELLRAHLSNSVTDEEAVLFEARGLTPGDSAPEVTERLQVRWLPLDEALRLATAGDLTDAMTLLALQRIALERAGLT
jgi:8-oxo-dGTP pyrophosphatase MutT (NUDIX family)